MNVAELEKKNNNVVKVKGVLDSDTIMPLISNGYQWIDSLTKIIFDFIDVTESDSVALALLLAWIRYAKKSNKKIFYQHIPDTMIEIAVACRLDKIFSFQVDHK